MPPATAGSTTAGSTIANAPPPPRMQRPHHHGCCAPAIASSTESVNLDAMDQLCIDREGGGATGVQAHRLHYFRLLFLLPFIK